MLASNLRQQIKGIQTKIASDKLSQKILKPAGVIAQRAAIFTSVLALSLGTLTALPLNSRVVHAAGNVFSGTLATQQGNSYLPSTKLSGVVVSLVDQNQVSTSAITDGNGYFSISVPAGKYALWLNNYSSNVAGMSSFTLRQSTSNPGIDMTRGNLVQDLTLNTALIRATTYNAQGYKTSYVSVNGDGRGGTTKLYPFDPGTSVMQVVSYSNSDNSGVASLTSIAGTTYNSGSLCAPAGCVSQSFTAPIYYGTNDIVNIDVPKTPAVPYHFTGNLANNSGTKISGAQISLIDQYQNQVAANTDGNGNFNVAAQPGKYAVRISYNGATNSGLNGVTLQQPTTNPTIDLTTGDKTQNLTVNTTTITAYVLDAYGNFINFNAISGYAVSGTTSLYPGDPGTTVASVNNYMGNGYAPCNTTFTTIDGAVYSPSNFYANFSNSPKVQYLAAPLTVNGPSYAMLRDTSLGTPLPSPTGLTVPSPTNKPTLTWDPVAGAVSYKVYRDCLPIGTTTSTSYTDTTASASAKYMVSAVDAAGIASNPTQPVNVELDILAPAVSATWSRQAVNGWHNGPVTVTITCFDPYGKGDVKTCTPSEPVTFATDGANQQLTYKSTDYVGNVRQGTITVNLDQTAPVINTPTWSRNPTLVGSNATLTVPVTDATSGIASGEYYIGNTDPGVGKATALTLSGSNLLASIGANLPAGVYSVNVRAKDKAGNWSGVTTTKLAVGVFAPTNVSATSPTETPQISWTGTSGATSYNVYRNGVLIGSATSTSYTDNTAPEGSLSYYVTSISANGESLPSSTITVLVDRSAPDIGPIISPDPSATGWVTSLPATVSFNCSDSGSGLASCTSPVTLTQEGTFVVTGTAVDKMGHSRSINVFVSIDTTKPTITFTAASSGWVNTDAGVPYECTNDDGTKSQYTAPIVTGPDGQTTATGTCTDQAGNTTTQVIPVKVDTAVPAVDYHVSQPTNALGWSTAPVTVTFECQDPDGGAPGSASGIAFCSDPVTVTAEGTTVVTGIARDIAGNYNELNVFISIDSVKPTLTPTVTPANPNANGWYNSDVTISFTCSDATSGVAVCPQPITVKNNGTQTITATAKDVAGNTQTVEVPIKLDKTIPNITPTLSTPSVNGWSTGPVTVTFECQDPDGGVAGSASGIEFCSDPVTVTAEGTTVVTGIARDKAGNINEINVFVSIDSVKPIITPTITPTSPNANDWYNSDVTISFTCSDATSGVAVCPQPITVKNDGAQAITATARDVAGNIQTVTIPINLDKTAPDITSMLSATPVNGWNNGPVTVTFDCTDATSTIDVCTPPVTLTEDGIHLVTGAAVDKAGNQRELNVTVQIDSTLPTATNAAFTANPKFTTDPSATLTAEVTDPTVNGSSSGIAAAEYFDPVQQAWLPMTVSGSTATVTFNTPEDTYTAGSYTFQVRTTDVAGNVSTPVNASLLILDPNQAPVINPLAGGTITEGGAYNENGTYSDPDSTLWTATVDYGDGSGTQPLPLSGINFALGHIYADEGTYTVTVAITDGQGATGTKATTVTVTNVAPSISVITASNNPITVGSSTTASATFTDPGNTDTHTAVWDWGDGTTSAGTITESNGSGSVSDTHVYTTVGVYTIKLTITDNDGATSTRIFKYLSVYDPTPQGLFTGARIFDSPQNAYTANPSFTGQAMFGISAQYNANGQATGKVSMSLKAANFDFASTGISALVITNGIATLQGTGAVNGVNGYGFLITGQSGAGSAGKVRFQITDASGQVVYDSQPGTEGTTAPSAAVTGAITIHQ